MTSPLERIPAMVGPMSTAKTRRLVAAGAMAVMAVALRLADDGKTCADARIVVGAVREGPVRASAAERSSLMSISQPVRRASVSACLRRRSPRPAR